MKKLLLWALATICTGFLSAHAEIAFYKGGQYQLVIEQQPFRVYQDLGDRNASNDDIREGYVLLDNQIAAAIKFGWPTYSQKWRLVIQSGTATWLIGEGDTLSATSVPFTGTTDDNAIYLNTAAQSIMSNYSPEKGINLTMTTVNGVPIQD